MKVKIEGRRNIATLRQILNTICDRLEAEGIDEITGGNLYFTPYQNSEKVEFVNQAGNPIYWTYTEPTKIKKPRPSRSRSRHLKAL